MALDLSQFQKSGTTKVPLDLNNFKTGGAAVPQISDIGGGLVNAAKATSIYGKSYLERAGQGFIEAGQGMVSDIQKAGESFTTPGGKVTPQTIATGALQAAEVPAKAIFMRGFPAAFNYLGGIALSDAISTIIDKSSELPQLQRAAMGDALTKIVKKTDNMQTSLGEFARNNPDLADASNIAFNALAFLTGAKVAPTATRTAINTAEQVAAKTGEVIGNVDVRAGGAAAERAAVQNTARAQAESVAATVDNGAKNSLRAPFRSSYNPEAAAAFQRQGIEPPVSALSTSHAVQSAEAIAQATVFGGPITKAINDARQSIFDITEKLKKNIGSEVLQGNATAAAAALRKTITAEEAGKALQTATDEITQIANKAFENVWKPLEAKINKNTALLDNSRAALEDLIKQRSASAVPQAAADVKYFQTMLKNLGGANKRTFENVNATRTDIGRRLAAAKRGVPSENAGVGELKYLYAALTEDLNATAAASGSEAARAVAAAKAMWKAGKQRLGTATMLTIYRSKTPERLVQTLFNRGDISVLQEMRATFPPEVMQKVAGSFLNGILEKSFVPLTGRLSASKLAGLLSKYGDTFLKSMLGEKGFAEIKGLLEAAVKDDIYKQSLVNGIVDPRRLANALRAYDKKVLEQAFPPADMAALIKAKNAAIVNDIIAKGTKDGRVMPADLARVMDYYGEKTLAEALTPVELQTLKDARVMSKAIAIGAKAAEGSPTGRNLAAMMHVGGAVGAGIGALLNPGVAIPGIILFLLGEYSISKIFTSQLGRQFLTKGIEKGAPAAEKAGNVVEAVKPPIVAPGAKPAAITRYSETAIKPTPIPKPAKKPLDLKSEAGFVANPFFKATKISAIPKELEPLAAKARKYKSAEEFSTNVLADIQKQNPQAYKDAVSFLSSKGADSSYLTDFYNQVTKGKQP
jgi:hypothetical protein